MPSPDCRFRSATPVPLRWRCQCTFLPIPRTFVTEADCQICPVANGLVSTDDSPVATNPSGHQAILENSRQPAGSDPSVTFQIPFVSAEALQSCPRHLIYHLYPVRSSVWRDNVQELRQRIGLFTGRRIVTAAFDQKTDSREVVEEELADLGAEIRTCQNQSQLGEAASMLSAVQEIATLPGMTFYAHAKGVTHHDPSVVFGIWTRRMYALLDRFAEVCELLTRCGFCGLIRSTGQPVAESRHQWHYPGSFYWFRNDVVAQRGFSFDRFDRFLTEKFPSHIVRFTESAALHSQIMLGNPYRRETWLELDESGELPAGRNGHAVAADENHGWGESQPLRTDESLPHPAVAAQRRARPSFIQIGRSFQLSQPATAAIVIAGRNNAPFLAEAIESALAQTIPCEVVYADDCSIDDSLRIASEYLRQGLRILPNSVHQGVCDARNRGARATLAEHIVFLDADDRLPPDYAARCLAVMTPDTPFVYSATHAFGSLINHKWEATPWESYDLWQHNQVHTSAMWSRWAFTAAGEWQDDIPTMWDYDLAIRCSRFGTPVRSSASIGYRTHAGSISVALNERDGKACIPFKEMIRRKNARLGIGCLVSGRLPGLFPKWMDDVACSVRWAMRFGVLKQMPRLQLYLHNATVPHCRSIQETASRYLDTFASVDIRVMEFEYPSAPEIERRNGSATLLAKASADMQSHSGADVFWFIEDDILVPIRACAWLFQELTAGANPPHGISGVYRNRHIADRCIGGWRRSGRYDEPANFAVDRIQPVDFTGTGCLMFWTNRPETPRQWRTHTEDAQAAHDFRWGDDLRLAGGRLLMHGGIRCQHAQSEADFLQC